MYAFVLVFYLLDFLVLISPVILGFKRGSKIGVRSTLVWVPVLAAHALLFYVAMGCGHGSGNGGLCNFQYLIALGPQTIALFVFYLIYKKTENAGVQA